MKPIRRSKCLACNWSTTEVQAFLCVFIYRVAGILFRILEVPVRFLTLLLKTQSHINFSSVLGPAMVQAVSRRPFAAKYQIRSLVSARATCRKSGIVTDLFPNTSATHLSIIQSITHIHAAFVSHRSYMILETDIFLSSLSRCLKPFKQNYTV